MFDLQPGISITIIKLDPSGTEKIRYQGQVKDVFATGVLVDAYWSHPPRDLGYTTFETGDHFSEYYYTDRWYNVFTIEAIDNTLKGWYCNVTQPAHIFADRIEQIDLYLDVWINNQGIPLILDEDEFIAASELSLQQRQGAQQGLQSLLKLLTTRQEMFVSLSSRV